VDSLGDHQRRPQIDPAELPAALPQIDVLIGLDFLLG